MPSNATQRIRADSYSTDDHHQYPYVRERSRKSLPSSPSSSYSLRRLVSRHNDIPDNTPGRILAISSPQSSPVTSPSSAHGGSSRFADSQSSFTSESASTDPWSSRSGCEDRNRVPSTTMRPLNFGTPPSPIPGRSRSITESDLRLPVHGSTRTPASKYPVSLRPRTAPHSPSPTVSTENPDSHVSMGIKFLLSKPALPSPALRSSSASESRSPSRHAIPLKPRPHPTELELDVSATPFPLRNSPPDHTGVPPVNQDSIQSSSSIPTHGRGGKHRNDRNVLRRKPSTKAKEKEKIQRELEEKRNTTASPSSSSSARRSVSKESPSAHSRDWSLLTPARTVIQAYKQRENPSSVQPPAEEDAADEHASPSPTPYYTVYGTRSEHTVAADGPDDARQWLLHEHVLADRRAQKRQEEPNKNLSRKGSLSRMVSGSWKRATGGGDKAGESRPPSREHAKGRSSLQEGHFSGLAKDRRECIDAGGFGTNLHQTRSVTEPRSNLKESPVEGGSKIWKLMKRLSTGGMRERFVADQSVPPVPAIPKELLNSTPPQSHAFRAGSQKSYSPSMPRNIANSGPRPSMATSSSSPNSSDVASTRFFQKSHSRRSSVSSYGEETAPLSSFPSISHGDHHIVPPRELHQIARDLAKNQSSTSYSRSHSHPGQAADGKTNPDDQRPRIASPTYDPWETPPRTVPSSSVTQLTSLSPHGLGEKPATVAHVQLLPDGNMSLSPPPRPTRSAMRASRVSQSENSHAHCSPAAADEESAVRTSLYPRASSSLSEASTATIQPLETLDVSHLHSGINFRELSATPRRAPLTEHEKAEKWDDLLLRSEQAGGTLHLGASGQLESDNLRFSSYSEVSRS